ncbi:MAG: hypothetical protein NZ870_02290, partial [bacterium]|nr:hypothetical protein [bacterium]
MFLFINTIRNIEYVILFRVVQGLGLVMYFVAVLTMVNSISKKIKNSFFIYNTMLYMPMIYSSPLAKFLYDTKESYAFYYIVVMSIIGALLIIPIKTIKLEKQGIKIGLKLFLDPVFGKFFISLILLILADAFIYMCLPLHSQGRFMGLYFMLWGASTTVFRFFYAIKTINAEFDISKYTLGLILISAMILLFDLRLAFLSLSAILHGWGWAILDPLIMHQVASRFYNYPEGPLMSSFSVSYDIGYLFGPILFSMIYYEAGFEFALLVGVFLTFIGVHIWQKIK